MNQNHKKMVVKDEKTDLRIRKNGNEDKSEIIGMYVPLERERERENKSGREFRGAEL